MQYSPRSFDPDRLTACFGAIQATFPDIVLAAGRSAPLKTGAEAAAAFRRDWDRGNSTTLVLHFDDGPVTLDLSKVWDLFYVRINGGPGPVQNQIHALVRDTLGLTSPSEAELESEANLSAINQRILRIQKLIASIPAQLGANMALQKLRCFVSFRFDEHSKALALELRNFIELAGLEFVSGQGYEPRSVSEKVLDRLSGRIDLFVVIFATAGESAWLHQEIGVAKGRHIPIMVLREAQIPFDEALLSDIEYATFPSSHISEAFIPLLQALQYIRLRAKASQNIASP